MLLEVRGCDRARSVVWDRGCTRNPKNFLGGRVRAVLQFVPGFPLWGLAREGLASAARSLGGESAGFALPTARPNRSLLGLLWSALTLVPA